MKLGIVVVYLVSEENEKLLNLHLSQIERHTTVPYAIYGSINRLLPKFQSKLKSNPKITICQCPGTDLRDVEEHSFYLDHLVQTAIEDGSSHVVTLHVDSFPIRSGWAEELAGKLSESQVFATSSYGAYTACLFFHRDFYLKHHPTFLLSKADRSSPKYKQFCKEAGHLHHSGIGYLFKAYQEGLSWYPLTELHGGDSGYIFISSIYDDCIFHLGSVTKFERRPLGETNLLGIRKWVYRHIWAPTVRAILDMGTQQRVLGKKRFVMIRRPLRWGWRHIGRPKFYVPTFEDARKQLLEDPESYLNSLRLGER
jgi:hypothetical protein